jgi:hypothetical protein
MKNFIVTYRLTIHGINKAKDSAYISSKEYFMRTTKKKYSISTEYISALKDMLKFIKYFRGVCSVGLDNSAPKSK